MKRRGMMRERRLRDPRERRQGPGYLAQGRRRRGDAPPHSELHGDRREGREHHHEHSGQAERHRGRHGERGWRGQGRARVGRGDVRAAALMLLAEQPLHGYELIQQITTRSGGAWRPSPGSVYPALQLLEDQGLIRGEQTEGRRVYHLTEAGRSYIEQHRDELSEAWAGVTASGDDPTRELRALFEQLGGAVRQVGHAGTETQIAAAREVLTSARRQLYRILADDPVDGTPPDNGRS
jgi:DNA-binding PadR family transcriptional regulator